MENKFTRYIAAGASALVAFFIAVISFLSSRLKSEKNKAADNAATTADGKSPQPFRIYRITKPLSGVVEIDAEHISYQMSHIPVLPFEAVGMDPAFEGLKTNSAEENPFTIEKEGAFGTALANPFKVSEPNNLRALLFGSEGSLIDYSSK